MIISILPDPERHPLWDGIKGLLLPAAEMGGVPVLEENELVWVVVDGGQIIAAATTRVTVDGFAEIILCGGVGHRKWAVELADMICDWAKREGADRVLLSGRKGWARVLGWPIRGEVIEKVL